MANKKSSSSKAETLNPLAESSNGKLFGVNGEKAVFPTTPIIDNSALNDTNSVDVLPASNLSLNNSIVNDAFPSDAAVDSLLLDGTTNLNPNVPLSNIHANQQARVSASNGSGQPIITTPSSITSTPGSKLLNPDPTTDVLLYGNNNNINNTNSYTLSRFNSMTDDAPAAKHSRKKSRSSKSSKKSSKSLVGGITDSRFEVGPKEYFGSYSSHPRSLAVKKIKGKKGTSAPKRPAFVMKLWNMVNDKSNSKYISWMSDGKAFQVNDRESFMKYVLPKYFKHNNFASFVRQLNMYGWHKIQDVNSGSLLQGDEVWQFENPNFVRGREDLLDRIVRNKPTKETEEDELDINALLAQLESMRKSQKLIEEDLRRVREDNEMLWKENYLARERHKAQSETLNKILRFLATVYGSNSAKFLDHMNGPGSPEALNYPEKPSSALQTQDVYNYNYGPQVYRPRSNTASNGRLLISNEAYSSKAPSATSIKDMSQAMARDAKASQEAQEIQEIQEIHRGPENRNDPYLNDTLLPQSPALANSPKGFFPELVHTPQIKYQPLAINQSQTNNRGDLFGADSFNDVQQQIPQQNLQHQQHRHQHQHQHQQAGRSDSVISRPEELMGNIHNQLNKNQGTLKQVNDWITKLSGKPSEEVLSGSQDELNDLLMPQSLEMNDNAGDLNVPDVATSNGNDNSEITSNRINELYDEIEDNLKDSPSNVSQIGGPRSTNGHKRKGSSTGIPSSGSKKQKL